MRANPALLFFMDSFKQVGRRKLSTLLTVISVMIAVFLYLGVFIVKDSYVADLYEEAENFSDQGVLIYGNINSYMLSALKERYGNYYINAYTQSVPSEKTKDYIVGDNVVAALESVVGTSENMTSGLVLSSTLNNSAFESEIVSGRDISLEDINSGAHVLVISEMAEDMLFGGKSAIGEYIDLNLRGTSVSNDEWLVIGVYESSLDDNNTYNKLLNEMDGQVLFTYFAPYTALYDYELTEETPFDSVTVKTGDDVLVKADIASYLSSASGVTVTYSEEIMHVIYEANELEVKRVNIIMTVVIVISGFGLLNTMMFSVSQRVSEIGIRKAVGATGFDILWQFMLEALITSMIGAALGVAVVVFIATGFQIYRESHAYGVEILLTYDMILKTFSYIILMAIVSGIIPAIIAARVKVSEAVRFD